MNNIIGLKPSQPFTLCEPITVDLRIAATVLLDRCHELFCIFGNFYASWMQDAEVTKSLGGGLRPKGVPFPGFRYMKGWGFHPLIYMKG